MCPTMAVKYSYVGRKTTTLTQLLVCSVMFSEDLCV